MAGPDRDKLKKIINDHFVYEITELYWCKTLWTMPRAAGYDQAFINMNIEHTLLHARSLYEFYYMLDTNPNNYNPGSLPKANMYVASFTRPTTAKEIKSDFYKKANDQINHLGIDRTSVASDKFTVAQTIAIANDLLAITKDFLKPLETEGGGFFFDVGLKDLKSNIDAYLKFDPVQVVILPPAIFPTSTSVVAVTTSSLTSGNIFPSNPP